MQAALSCGRHAVGTSASSISCSMPFTPGDAKLKHECPAQKQLCNQKGFTMILTSTMHALERTEQTTVGCGLCQNMRFLGQAEQHRAIVAWPLEASASSGTAGSQSSQGPGRGSCCFVSALSSFASGCAPCLRPIAPRQQDKG